MKGINNCLIFLCIFLWSCAAVVPKRNVVTSKQCAKKRSASVYYKAKHVHWLVEDNAFLLDSEGLIDKTGEGWTTTRNLFTGLAKKISSLSCFSKVDFISVPSAHDGELKIDITLEAREKGGGLGKTWYGLSLVTFHVVPFWWSAEVYLKAKVNFEGRDFHYSLSRPYEHLYFLLMAPVALFMDNFGEAQMKTRDMLVDDLIAEMHKDKLI